jgi:sulfatase modifying factor 1
MRYGDMIRLPGGTFSMGSTRFYPEEDPVRRVRVNPFAIDAAPVTNAAFAAFVAATGYVTMAERAPDPKDYPDMDPALAEPGSLVFERTASPVDMTDVSQWWHFRPGADWRHPLGPGSSVDDLGDHPVVHVTHADAEAFAHWAGRHYRPRRSGSSQRAAAWRKRITPGETNWRRAARCWPITGKGSSRSPTRCSTDMNERTSPVGSYPANGYGVYDMIGNVWEWTADWYATPSALRGHAGPRCCAIANPRGARRQDSYDPEEAARIPRKVLKGGSHLCAESYCRRYRPAARHAQPIDSATTHIGFRCVTR